MKTAAKVIACMALVLSLACQSSAAELSARENELWDMTVSRYLYRAGLAARKRVAVGKKRGLSKYERAYSLETLAGKDKAELFEGNY